MAELKTKATGASVKGFLASVENERRRRDAETVNALMKRVTGWKAVMWGASIVGFGRYKYTYNSGHSGEWMITGFSPRKQNLTVYIMPGFSRYADQLARLGKHKTAKSCLYINKLDDIDLDVLEELVRLSVAEMVERYGP